ncbi:MAG: hypothetical protein IIY02_00485, partial [Firmicutes bacterium]|nr:hypothetical protein [Bacillota bacterium]
MSHDSDGYSYEIDEVRSFDRMRDIDEFVLERDGDLNVERNDESYRKGDSQTGGYFRGDDRGTIDTSGHSGEGNDNAAIYESNGALERAGDHTGIDRNQKGENSRGNPGGKYAAHGQVMDDPENLPDELLLNGKNTRKYSREKIGKVPVAPEDLGQG